MKDTDIEGMDKKNLREYLYSLILARKKAEKEKEKLSQELKKWESRVKLAEERGELELKEQALLRLEELRRRITNTSAEFDEITREIEGIKKKLKDSIGKINYNVDTELLLEELNLLTGGTNDRDLNEDRAIKEIKANLMLKELKKKLKGKEDSDTND